MAKCEDCEQEMQEAESCLYPDLILDNVRYPRDTAYYDCNERCHDCGIVNGHGNVHHFGCDMERCPICKGQLISCGCLSGKEIYVAKPIAKGS